MTNRREFLQFLIGALITAPLIALGWKKTPKLRQFVIQDAVSSDGATGLGIRYISKYDASQDRMITRLDATYGWGRARAPLLKPGDIFTISGYYEFDPLTRAPTSRLRQFIATQ